MPKPLHLRRLKADMALKDLRLRTIAERAGVSYAAASELLNGRRVDPSRLAKLAGAIKSAPMPREEALAR